MKSFQTILAETSLISEASDQTEYKAIFSQDGKKIDGERTGKLLLGFAQDGKVTNVTWKQFKASKLPWSTNQVKDDCLAKKNFIMALMKQEKQFNKKVDANRALHDKSLSFEDKVDKIFAVTSAKYPKTGLKS